MRNIYYFPKQNSLNSYCERFKECLSHYGVVKSIDIRDLLKYNFFFGRKEIIFLNWFENIILNKKGRVSNINIVKLIFIFLLFKLIFKKIVFIRHNNYPHSCNEKEKNIAKKIISKLEAFSDYVIVHSPKDTDNFRYYVSHPLYDNNGDYNIKNNVDSKTYIVFGRIEKYKKIENLIINFPEGFNLVVAGKCSDKLYLKDLLKLSYKRKNISIISHYLTDEEAKEIIQKSNGILITHNEDDMIVSGSFFYGLSVQSKVYALQTPFFQWAKDEMGNRYIETFISLTDMISRIKENVIKNEEIGNGKTPVDLFGDETIIKQLKVFFD
ncbi:hypothetical protein [uncultured Acinetobacter sp.]|uniref:hypothetical protein n=1 Tax=uncultured Acinetobacter sp. TaxID=165433 RepID=UPI00258D99DD|nr:hypothetical protein [uncultured Acinetobacter sp.]